MNNIVYNNKNYIIYQSSKYNENKPKPPFHDDKKMLTIILEILNNSNVFIETGSYMGKTIFFVGMPGCARSQKENGVDWILWRIFCGLDVSNKDINQMGAGGLL